MKLDVETTIDAPANTVWTLLSAQFGDISDWCATVNSSTLLDGVNRYADAPARGRHCETTFGPFDETFLSFDTEKMSLSYEAKSDKLPFFVKRLTNQFDVTALDANRSRVVMRSGAEMTQPFRTIMGPMMKLQMGKALSNLVGELKHFAETGTPHPRKVKAQQKAARKAAA